MILRNRTRERWTTVSNDTVRDSNLSWKARGILFYLLSMPDGWDANIRQLAGAGPDGRESVSSGMRELEDAGYLKRRKFRTEHGTFEWEIEVLERPCTENRDMAQTEPCTGNPDTGNSDTENPAIYKRLPSSKEEELSNNSHSPETEEVPEIVAVVDTIETVVPTLNAPRLPKPKSATKAADSPTFNSDFIALWANYSAVNPGTSRPLALKKAKALTAEEWDTLIANFPAWLESWKYRASIGEAQFIKHLHRFIEERMFTGTPPKTSHKKNNQKEPQTSEPEQVKEFPVLARYMGHEDRLKELGFFTEEGRLWYYKNSQSYSEEYKWGKTVPDDVVDYFKSVDERIDKFLANKRDEENES